MPVPSPPTGSHAPSGGLPKIARRADQETQAQRALKSAPFWLVFAPGRYCVMEGQVVPLLNEFKLQSGVNGVLELKDGTLIVDDAEQNLRGKGATVVPWDVDGPDEPYLVEPVPGCWVTRWTRPGPTGQAEPDLVGYAGWLGSLYERGILPRPSLHDLGKLAGQLRFDIEESSKNPAIQPYRVTQLKKQLAVVERELEIANRRDREEAEERAEEARDRRARRSSELEEETYQLRLQERRAKQEELEREAIRRRQVEQEERAVRERQEREAVERELAAAEALREESEARRAAEIERAEAEARRAAGAVQRQETEAQRAAESKPPAGKPSLPKVGKKPDGDEGVK